jgi:L-serine dehydratase
MNERSSIFDMIGPIMIGPSSSHTAGVVRIGRVARWLLGATPDKIEVTFYNSFATTYEGHGSDRAIVGGLLGFDNDDERIRNSLDIAKEQNISVQFKPVLQASVYHPNTIRVKAYKGERSVEVLGVSRGGGLISIKEVDGFNANFTGQLHTLVILAQDIKGSIAFIADVIAHDDCNIATMTVSRNNKNENAKLIIEMDSPISNSALEYLKHLKWVKEVIYLPEIG